MSAYLLLIIAISLGVVGQLLLKRGMGRHPAFRPQDALALARDPYVVGGFGAYGLSVLLYFRVLAELPLSIAYPFVSLGYVLVILFSRLLFAEEVPASRWLAVAIICSGVALVGLGS